MITKVISGGQTGADRGALEGALDAVTQGWTGSYGGCAPKGWKAEDGVVPALLRLHMYEHASAEYAPRTKENILQSDATLILYSTACNPRGYGSGTSLTIRECIAAKKRVFMVNLARGHLFLMDETTRWAFLCVTHERSDEFAKKLATFDQHNVKTLNVAGPRESHAKGLQAQVRVFIRDMLLASHGASR